MDSQNDCASCDIANRELFLKLCSLRELQLQLPSDLFNGVNQSAVLYTFRNCLAGPLTGVFPILHKYLNRSELESKIASTAEFRGANAENIGQFFKKLTRRVSDAQFTHRLAVVLRDCLDRVPKNNNGSYYSPKSLDLRAASMRGPASQKRIKKRDYLSKLKRSRERPLPKMSGSLDARIRMFETRKVKQITDNFFKGTIGFHHDALLRIVTDVFAKTHLGEISFADRTVLTKSLRQSAMVFTNFVVHILKMRMITGHRQLKLLANAVRADSYITKELTVPVNV